MKITEITVKDFQLKKEIDKISFLNKLENVDILTFDFIMYNIGAITSLAQTHLTLESKKVDNLTIDKVKEISKELQDKIIYTIDLDPLEIPEYINKDELFDLYIDSDNSNPGEISILLLVKYSALCDALIERFKHIRDDSNEDG